MALKDWKKVKEKFNGESIPSWLNKQIGKQIYVSPSFNEYVFSVTSYPSSGYLEDETKVFKTKSQALKYARDYMRKN